MLVFGVMPLLCIGISLYLRHAMGDAFINLFWFQPLYLLWHPKARCLRMAFLP